MSDTELVPKPKGARAGSPAGGVYRGRASSPLDSEQKARIVFESYESGETVWAVARRHRLTPQQLFGWRRNGWPARDGKGGLYLRR